MSYYAFNGTTKHVHTHSHHRSPLTFVIIRSLCIVRPVFNSLLDTGHVQHDNNENDRMSKREDTKSNTKVGTEECLCVIHSHFSSQRISSLCFQIRSPHSPLCPYLRFSPFVTHKTPSTKIRAPPTVPVCLHDDAIPHRHQPQT